MTQDNDALKAYCKKLAAEPNKDRGSVDLNKPAEVLLKFQTHKKKTRYEPPYARAKLACKFHNGRYANLFSYDYIERHNLQDHNENRILDEGMGLRQLIELANKWNDLDRLEVATLYVSITKGIQGTYTGTKQYDLALGQWGSHIPKKLRPWKTIDHKWELLVKKPVYARVESLIDLDYLDQYDLKLDLRSKYY